MNDTEELWRRIHESFDYHRELTDPDAQAAMDRHCVRSAFARPRENRSMRDNCAVREGLLAATSLHELRLISFTSQSDTHLNGPIIILLYDEAKVVIEGNTRVNAWIARQFEGPFGVIMVEPHENAV